MTAKYLLRFDDLCPTMNWRVWSEIEAVLIDRRLKPILAVVPDNRDPMLQVGPPAQDFWERVRTWQRNGWTIGLHGFQHHYTAEHTGLGTSRKKTEFAGFPQADQEVKLRQGIETLNAQGIQPRVWIAPNNSFDGTTVALLAHLGIHVICDGCFRFPFRDPHQILWVPQQLHGFRPAPAGVWTVCYHHNSWTAQDLARFANDVQRYDAHLSSLDEIMRTWASRRSRWSAWLCRRARFAPLLTRLQLKLQELRGGIPGLRRCGDRVRCELGAKL